MDGISCMWPDAEAKKNKFVKIFQNWEINKNPYPMFQKGINPLSMCSGKDLSSAVFGNNNKITWKTVCETECYI